MRLFSLAAVSALLATAVVASPIDLPASNTPLNIETKVYFSPGTTQEFVEDSARLASQKGAQILGYFGLPPNGHDMGFIAHLSMDASVAIAEKAKGKAGIALVTPRNGFAGTFCPESVPLC